MKKINKFLKTRIKSILGTTLAIILTFTFNFMPINVVSNVFQSKSSAYTSSKTASYYGLESNQSESKIKEGVATEGTSDYFNSDSNNYNILTNYTKQFNNLFAKYADEYLASRDEAKKYTIVNENATDEQDKVKEDNYNVGYKAYITYISGGKYSTLSEYYNANRTSLSSSYSTFTLYFENFVTNEVTWTDSKGTHTLQKLFNSSDATYQSQIYYALANFLYTSENPHPELGDDGLTGSKNFDYAKSTSYLRVKKFIDDEIALTTPIYAFDGITQNENVAAIIATGAPTSQTFYYKNGDYESVTTVNITYVSQNYKTTNNLTYTKSQVFYFGNKDNILPYSKGKVVIADGKGSIVNAEDKDNQQYSVDDSRVVFSDEVNNVDVIVTISDEITTSPISFRLIQKGEFGYIDEDHPTYYKYSSIPYDTTNSVRQVYVVNDEVSANDKATYDSLYYTEVVSSDEIKNDRDNIKSVDYVQKSGKNVVYVLDNNTEKTQLELQIAQTDKIYVLIPNSEETSITLSTGTEEETFTVITSANEDYELITDKTLSESRVLPDGYNFYYKITTETFEILTNSELEGVNGDKIYEKITGKTLSNSRMLLDYENNYVFYYKTIIDTSNCRYVQIPYLSNNNSGSIYFENLYGTNDLSNLVNKVFTKNNESIAYFKISSRTTPTNVIYVKSEDMNKIPSDYSYTVKKLTLGGDENITMDDYQLLISGNSGYTDSCDVYYKKNRTYFTTTTHTYKNNEYELVETPNIEYETINVATKEYEYETDGNKNLKVYALVDDTFEGEKVNINGKDFDVIKSDDIQLIRNLYVEVPTSDAKELGGEDNTYPLYYKHKEEVVNKLYIVDDSEDAKDNEVYKNLNFTVITSDKYKSEFYKYVAVETTDSNYNKNFTLYYGIELNEGVDSAEEYRKSDMFVQNLVTGYNAVYIVTDSLSATNKTTYRKNRYTAITTSEFNSASNFYVKINENDTNYSDDYTLYYKYANKKTTSKKIYIYSTSSDSTYNAFSVSSDDYDANDYELIKSTDPNFVEGKQLYYKKIRQGEDKTTYDTKNTTYYLTNNSSVTLSKNSYYLLSFYVYTNGNYKENNPVEASFYVTDDNNIIDDISIEGISTNGKWVKYNLFIETNAISDSKISFSMYMGNNKRIDAEKGVSTVTGTVMFDQIIVTKIGVTDFNKKTLDGKPVSDKVAITVKKNLPIVTQEMLDEDTDNLYELVENKELPDIGILDDSYTYYEKGNVVYVYVESTEEKNTAINVTTGYVENSDEYKNNSIVKTYYNRKLNDEISENWSTKFEFEKFSKDSPTLTFTGEEDGYTKNSDWHYYISRDVSGQGNNEKLKAYRQAYKDGKVVVEVVDEKDVDKTEKDTTETDSKETDSKDVPTTEYTFIDNNKVLKIENKDKLKSLGVATPTFVINQAEYYKVTVWVYSNDEDSTATIKLESVLKTANTAELGSLLSVSASNIETKLSEYSTKPTNEEYGFIPVSFYIKGNAYSNKEVYLVLLADSSSTVFFDNITIEKVSSDAYNAVSSSDSLTYTLTLSPDNSLVSAGITNGYFNLTSLKENYVDVDYTKPRTAENWTVKSSADTIGGVVSTSKDYTDKEQNFFNEYNKNKELDTDEYKNVYETCHGENIYAIYMPEKVSSPLIENSEKVYDVTNSYKIYTSGTTTVSANSLNEVSFYFYKGYNFSGKLVANLYNKSVADSNLLSNFSVEDSNIGAGWVKYTFYVSAGTTSVSLVLEIGVENATGTCFFKNVRSISSTYSSITEARDTLVSAENKDTSIVDIDNYSALSNIKLVDLSGMALSAHSSEESSYDLYKSSNYTNSDSNTKTYTVGEVGTVVASYYTSTKSTYYTVKIEDVDYIAKDKDGNNVIKTDEDKVYYILDDKLYSDSMFKTEVIGFNLNGDKKVDNNEVNTETNSVFEISYVGDTAKVSINSENPLTATTVNDTKYIYNFTNDIFADNNIIKASELTNNYSQNLLILSNSKSTDYTNVKPTFTATLSSSTYYVVRVYVKTGNIKALTSEESSGLNISIDKITANWTNINTENAENADENGFVCYEVWVKTNTSSISSLTVEFSLGSSTNPCSGYAIIADVEIEKFDSKTTFDEYCSANEELYDSENKNSLAKKYILEDSSNSNSNSNSNSTNDDSRSSSSILATFFYVFSSLLLGFVLVLALVAIFIKKHPIKHSTKVKPDSDVIVLNPKDVSEKTVNDAKKEALRKQKEEEKANPDLSSETEQSQETAQTETSDESVEEKTEETPSSDNTEVVNNDDNDNTEGF